MLLLCSFCPALQLLRQVWQNRIVLAGFTAKCFCALFVQAGAQTTRKSYQNLQHFRHRLLGAADKKTSRKHPEKLPDLSVEERTTAQPLDENMKLNDGVRAFERIQRILKMAYTH